MRTYRVDHIGIAVRSIEAARPLYVGSLSMAPEGLEEVADQGVRVAFFALGGTHVELVEPTDPSGAVARFIGRRGEGMHHVALAVPDVAAALDEARQEGLRTLDDRPRRGARGRLIAFLDPASTGGVLIELCQAAAGP